MALFIPTPTPGKQGNVALVQADRLVDFYDRNEKVMKFWWSDIHRIAYDSDGVPIRETLGTEPGSQLDLEWSK